MFDIRDKPKMVERALLIGIHFKGDDRQEADSLLVELNELVDTLGIPVLERRLVSCVKPQARMLLGTGKADELIALAHEINADVIVVDNDLSPAQQRTWEKISGLCVIDREEVILDIFAGRAFTKEARLQVELARMQYSLPRLTRAWTHLSRQSGSGGTGLRGEGEKQLEVDRRMVYRRIDQLKSELASVRKRRATQRKERLRVPFPHAAIVGYTNAGKSSLLRRLTDANVLVEDKLFATLDTTTRKIVLPDGQSLLLTDTVGFVRKLPHRLVEAFKATLEEAVLADFRIHMVDASHPQAETFYQTTMDVLEELGADLDKTLTVFNKIDLVENRSHLIGLRNHFPDAVFISAKTGEGIDTLMGSLANHLSDLVTCLDYCIPAARSDLVATLHDTGKVIHTEYVENDVHVKVILPKRLQARFAQYEVDLKI